MNARLLINKLPLSLGKIKPAELCNALKPVGPIYLHGRGQIPWVRIEREGSIPMGHCAGERCIVKSSLLLEKIRLSLNEPNYTAHWVWFEGRWLCEGRLQRRGKTREKRGSQWESNYNPLRLWGSTFISGAFVSPAPLVKERTSLFGMP